MKVAIWTALCLYLGFLSGCSSSPPLFLQGTWEFTIMPSNSSGSIQATAVLTQLGSSVFGPVTFGGNSSSCDTQAQMSGTVNGDNLSVQLTQSQSTLDLTGTVTGGLPVTYSASGKYTGTTGGCLQNGEAGTWTGFLAANSTSPTKP
jgi:hypothetical protein